MFLFVNKCCRVFALLFAGLFLAACGNNSTGYVEASGPKAGLKVTFGSKSALNRAEAEHPAAFDPQGNCSLSASPFLSEAQAAVDDFNRSLGSLQDFQPPVFSAVIKDSPPRIEGEVAVYLCGELDHDAYAVYRSVYVSNSFIGRLKNSAEDWGSPGLFGDALAYVLFHEMGHAVFNHSAARLEGDTGFDLPLEKQADEFAYRLMRMNGRSTAAVFVARSAPGP